MISSRQEQHQARQQHEHAEALKRKAERREAHERRMRRQAEEAARAKLERARRHKLHKEQEERRRQEKEQRRGWGWSAHSSWSEYNLNQNAYASSSSSGYDWSGMMEREAVARYEGGWERMRQVAAAGRTQLRFSDIPWPTLQPISSPQDLSRRSIESFVFSNSHRQGRDRRTHLRGFILQWHPDKFIGRSVYFLSGNDLHPIC